MARITAWQWPCIWRNLRLQRWPPFIQSRDENFYVCKIKSVDVRGERHHHRHTEEKLLKWIHQSTEQTGLGIDDLNDEVLAEHLHPDYPELWAPTDAWNTDPAHDRLWS